MGNLTDLVFFLKTFAEVPAVLEAEHCGDFTKTARRALRELAKPVEAHAEAFTPAEVSVIYFTRRSDLLETARRVELPLLCFPPTSYKSQYTRRALRGAFGVPSSR